MKRSFVQLPSLLLRCIRIAVPLIIGIAFVFVEMRRVSGQVAVRYPDFFAWSERASRFDPHNLAQWQWVDGLYPLGYPLLLWMGVTLGTDVLRTAFLLSIFGGFLGLIATFWLVRRMTGDWTLAVLTQFSLACMAFYLFYSNLDSTDALAAGLQLLSFPLLLRESPKRSAGMVAGLFIGLSYLIRYTASVTFVLCLAFLLGLWLSRRERAWLSMALFYILGTVLGAAPQLVASAIVTGNPLYTHQAHNLWFHLTGSADYIRDWNAVPMDISLWEVLAADPWRFFDHWWSVLKTAWPGEDIVSVDAPLGILTQAGFLYALLAPGTMRRSARAFMALYTVGLLVLLAFVRYDRRFLITLMPFQVFFCLYFLWNLLPARVSWRGWRLPVRVPLLLILLLDQASYPLDFMVSNPADELVVTVSNTLHAAGMTSARQVFSTHLDFHDVSDKWKSRYDMAFALARDLNSKEAVLDFVKSRGYSFFVFDRQTGLYLYPDADAILLPENRLPGLTPIFVPPLEERNFVIYRVEENALQQPNPVGIQLENGVLLNSYEIFAHLNDPFGEHWIGLYLHWQATSPLTTSLKVFVHLMDSNNQLVAQHDSVPALWTYPTHQWIVGEEVVDFHPLHWKSVKEHSPFTLFVGLYDPYTGERVPVYGAQENRILLTRVDFK